MKKCHYLIVILSILGVISIIFAESIFFLCIRYLGFSSRLSVLLPFIINLITGISIGIILFNTLTFSKVFRTIFAVFIPITFAIIFGITHPIYPEDFENRFITLSSSEYPQTLLEKYSNSSITCFFLINCPFCEKASASLDAMYKKGNLKDIEIIYYAYQHSADSIVEANNISIPYYVISEDTFFGLAGNAYPTIIYRLNAEIKFWAGNDVNYACFDYLTSLK